LDGEGYVQITDRTRDVIKSGGEWISSVELEDALMGHPAVFEAAVVALADSRWDERPLASVVLAKNQHATAEQLRAWLGDKLPPWWVPESWSFVSAIAKTGVGKFDKKGATRTAEKRRARDRQDRARGALARPSRQREASWATRLWKL
jgi:fatty-acyl-CoA synthase